jgi:hypothetical protein
MDSGNHNTKSPYGDLRPTKLSPIEWKNIDIVDATNLKSLPYEEQTYNTRKKASPNYLNAVGFSFKGISKAANSNRIADISGIKVIFDFN